MKNLLAIFFISIIAIAQGYACGCLGDQTLAEALQSTDFVFKGVILEVEIDRSFNATNYESANKNRVNAASREPVDSVDFWSSEIYYRIQIEEIYKGEYVDSVIVIHSGQLGAHDCKYEFEKGKSYIVFTDNKRTFEIERKLKKNGNYKRKVKYHIHIDKQNFETNSCRPNKPYDTEFEKEILGIINQE